MAKKPPSGGDYEVGRGKPPKHTRWKKNQSGNEKGRPAGSLNKKTLRAIYAAVLLQEKYRVKGSNRELCLVAGLLRKLASRGLEGDVRAAADVLDRVERLVASEPQLADFDLSEEDDAILREAFGNGKGDRGPVDLLEADAAEEPWDEEDHDD